MEQMWLSSSGTFTLIEFIPYSLWVGLGRSYTHSYQLVFTPHFTETLGTAQSKPEEALSASRSFPTSAKLRQWGENVVNNLGEDKWLLYSFSLSLWSIVKENSPSQASSKQFMSGANSSANQSNCHWLNGELSSYAFNYVRNMFWAQQQLNLTVSGSTCFHWFSVLSIPSTSIA